MSTPTSSFEKNSSKIIQVALPVPLRKVFDYRVLVKIQGIQQGCRVRVPFGNRKLVGVVTATGCQTELAEKQLKNVIELIDSEPLISLSQLKFLQWAASYYHHPLGEVIDTALPVLLRQGQAAEVSGESEWVLTSEGLQADAASLSRAPKQKALFEKLLAVEGRVMTREQLLEFDANSQNAIKGLLDKGLVEKRTRKIEAPKSYDLAEGPVLNDEQNKAVDSIQKVDDGFSKFLLHGITGSGKTEVYLKLIQAIVDAGKQVLVLVPEIGLTPQLIDRFRSRLRANIGLYHSGLNDRERLNAWVGVKEAKVQVLLGTRSSVFMPLPNLGMIIIDEEHDASFKQHEGFRYHARDLALVRARDAGIPILMGSATPSLESLYHVSQNNYQLLSLPARTGEAVLPHIKVLDLKNTKTHAGLSPQMVQAMREVVSKGEQCIVFLNRRGYSPVYMCHDCGWLAPCQRCDTQLVFHKASSRLRCHHCASEQRMPEACPQCNSQELHPLGEGTERLEEEIQKLVGSEARIMRLDRDSTRRKGSFEKFYNKILNNEVDIIVGTQMLAKGHDFPNVTLVVIVNVDQGLYSLDFRSSEHLMQQTMQVAGRAGRGKKAGTVLLQTFHPEHEVFAALKHHDYKEFANRELQTRSQAGFPPYNCIALFRAEAVGKSIAMDFLQDARNVGINYLNCGDDVEINHVVPAPMEKRAGRYRAQLMLRAKNKKALHSVITPWLQEIDSRKKQHQVRWSIDIDPVDLY